MTFSAEGQGDSSGWPEKNAWIDTPNATVNTTRPYLIRLKDSHSIAVFFYDGPRSRAIAFEGLLNDGNNLVQRLMGGFSDEDNPQLVHVATDGETYGHHHPLGEMALAWALKRIESEGHAQLTNYGQFLELFPPQFEAEIVENTSWSCAHGIERWRANCGCSGGHPGWHQEWRGPLRVALDNLRDGLAPLVQRQASGLFKNLDTARDAYIQVILDRDQTNSFLAEHASHELSPVERIMALQLMELERNTMLMYTSCGWFFDDISGIETVQVIAYAGRVVHLAAKLFGEDSKQLEQDFTTLLGHAKSNVSSQGDGAQIYHRLVEGLRVNLEQVAAHYAISSVFSTYGTRTKLFCYTVRRLQHRVVTSGRARLLIGRASIRSNLTEERETIAFAVLHFGDQNITAAVKPYGDDPPQEVVTAHETFAKETRASVIRADFPAVIRAFDQYFPGSAYSIRSLFRDEQRRIVDLILKSTLSEIEATLASIYENQASLLHFLSQAALPRPEALTLAASFAIDAGLRRALESEPIDALQMRAYLDLSQSDQVPLNTSRLGYIADQKMKRAMVDLHAEVTEQTEQIATIENALLVARTLNELPFDLNLWQAQNIWYDVWRHKPQPAVPDPEAWFRTFRDLGELLRISVQDLVMDE